MAENDVKPLTSEGAIASEQSLEEVAHDEAARQQAESAAVERAAAAPPTVSACVARAARTLEAAGYGLTAALFRREVPAHRQEALALLDLVERNTTLRPQVERAIAEVHGVLKHEDAVAAEQEALELLAGFFREMDRAFTPALAHEVPTAIAAGRRALRIFFGGRLLAAIERLVEQDAVSIRDDALGDAVAAAPPGRRGKALVSTLRERVLARVKELGAALEEIHAERRPKTERGHRRGERRPGNAR